VTALLDPDAVPTTATHLQTLSARGFLRSHRADAFGFRHVLVREAVYRAAPKRLRAELHERFADRLDETLPDLPELDEFVGYHLEQAYRLRTELGEADRRSEALAEGAGLRLGAAGLRALKRGDMPATVNLLDRALPLLPPDDERRHELLCELGIAHYSMGDPSASAASFSAAITGARAAGQKRVELRARIEDAYRRLVTEPAGGAHELLTLAEAAVPTFEALDDTRSLARAWLLIGYVQGGIHGNHAAWEEAEERALSYYRSTQFPPATCLQQIAAAIYWGPTPVPRGVERCNDLLAGEAIGHFGRAAVLPFLGGLRAQSGEFTEARELVADAQGTFLELGAFATAVVHCGTVRADIELLAGDLDAAEATLREQCDFLERTHDRVHLAVRAAKLAETYYREERLDEAERWAHVSRTNAATDDQSVQLIVGPVEAKLYARRGEVSKGRVLAEEVVRLADATDGLNLIAGARLALADVLLAADLTTEARRLIGEAIELFERKGNVVAAAGARGRLGVEVPA
jgi:tetratricopeptide (TPR) repeat protein